MAASLAKAPGGLGAGGSGGGVLVRLVVRSLRSPDRVPSRIGAAERSVSARDPAIRGSGDRAGQPRWAVFCRFSPPPEPPMPYDPRLVEPMRRDLTSAGVEELLTPDAVDAFMRRKGTKLLIVNSVCGCAAGMARPGAKLALKHATKPDHVGTVFARSEEHTSELQSQ